MNTLGNRIKQLRNNSKMTQQELGNIVGLHGTNIGRIEKDQVSPTADTLLKISQTYSVSIDWLITGESANSQSTNLEFYEFIDLWNELNDTDKKDTKEFMSYKISKYKKIELSASKNGKFLTATTEDIA